MKNRSKTLLLINLIAKKTLVVVILMLLTTLAHANSTTGILKNVIRGSVFGDANTLSNVDGDVTVVLPDSVGRVDVQFAFSVTSITSSEPPRVIVDLFEQQGESYTVAVSKANSKRFTKLATRLTCNASDLCTSTQVVYELPGSISDYMRGNEIILQITAKKARDSRLVLDALTLEQSNGGVTEEPTPLSATNDQASTNENQSVNIAVLENDTSGSGNDGIVISSVSSTSAGTTVIDGRLIRFTPATGFVGNATFNYTAYDTQGYSDSASVTVNVIADQITEPDTLSFAPGSTYYWQLQGPISLNYDVDIYGIDLEDNENTGIIQSLQNQGKKVVCYISAGSYEQWRSDKNEFDLNNDIGNPLGDWPGEYYLDINSENVRRIMRLRIDRAVAAGCDALEPDNTDAYQASNGLGLTAQDQIDYLLFLANYAHSKGLSIGLKNTVDLIATANLANVFDWTLNESCYIYNECNTLLPFIEANKAVFIAMYGNQSMAARCADANANNFHLAFYGSDYALDGTVYNICP